MPDPTDPTERIDELITDTPDWRGEMFVRLRRIIHEADPEVTEGWKWVTANRPGTPVWEHDGNVCHINILKDKVKLTLHDGAGLPDPKGVFNNGLDSNKTRALDIHEGDEIDEDALRDVIRAGVEYRVERAKAGPARKKT